LPIIDDWVCPAPGCRLPGVILPAVRADNTLIFSRDSAKGVAINDNALHSLPVSAEDLSHVSHHNAYNDGL
jgi:hypothetical protein